MSTKLKDTHLKKGQIWHRRRRWNGTNYDLYFRLKAKNSDNMWLLERIISVPEAPEIEPKEEWWSKERIVDYMKLISKSGNVDTLKILFGSSQ